MMRVRPEAVVLALRRSVEVHPHDYVSVLRSIVLCLLLAEESTTLRSGRARGCEYKLAVVNDSVAHSKAASAKRTGSGEATRPLAVPDWHK